MLKINRNIEVALQAIEALKLNDKPVRVSDLAAKIGTTENFLEQVVRKLRLDGITTSVRGPGGGVLLTNTQAVTVLRVAKALGHHMPHGNAMGTLPERVQSRLFGVMSELYL